MAKKVKLLRSEVCAFKERYPAASKTGIVRHFVDPGYVGFGIYNILTLLDNDQSIERKPDSGRPTTLSDKKLPRMLKRKTEGKVAKSLRALGREVGACSKTVWRTWTYMQEAAVPSTGLGAAGNDAATAVE